MVDQASSAADSASCSRTSHCRPQNGVRAAAAHHTSTALCVRGPRSAFRVIGVIAAPPEKVSAAGVDPTPQATHWVCKTLRPSMGSWSRLQRQAGVCCALNLQHDLYGAAPPAPFKSSAALLLPTGSRGVCANSLTATRALPRLLSVVKSDSRHATSESRFPRRRLGRRLECAPTFSRVRKWVNQKI